MTRRIRLWFCRVMGWHTGPVEPVGFDGLSVHAVCRFCGYEGLIDSTGGLF